MTVGSITSRCLVNEPYYIKIMAYYIKTKLVILLNLRVIFNDNFVNSLKQD